MAWYPGTEAAFAHLDISTTFDRFQHHFTNDVMSSLRYCVVELSRLGRASITADDLKQLRRDLSDLRITVLDAPGLDGDFRVWLLRLVDRMQAGLDDYQFRGPAAVRDATMQVFGEVQVRRATVRPSPVEAQVLTKVTAYLKAALLASKAIKAAMQLGGYEVPLLEGPVIDAPPIGPSLDT